MAEREESKDFQEKSVLQVHKAWEQAAHQAQWLAAEISKNNYLIPLSQAGDILPWKLPEKIPYTKSWFLGIVNFRGKLLSVIDVDHFLKGGSKEFAAGNSYSHIVTVNANMGADVGLAIDQLLGLKSEDEEWVRKIESPEPSPWEFVKYFDKNGLIWEEVQLPYLIASGNFLEVQL